MNKKLFHAAPACCVLEAGREAMELQTSVNVQTQSC